LLRPRRRPGARRFPNAVDIEGAALAALAAGYTPRPVVPLGVWDLSGQTVKAYSITAPGRALTQRARGVAQAQVASDRQVGGLGLGVVIVHVGDDGIYVIVQSWIEGYMSRLALFCGPAQRPDLLRPAPSGLAPCVWELAVLAHERDAFQHHLLDTSDPAAALRAWAVDTISGHV
jgi:hypothetical protein